jgi:hypothetical protein
MTRQTYPLRSPHPSPAAALPFDMSGPNTERARLRPITTRPSPSPSETRMSTGAAVAAAVVVVVVVRGITKYRPIARRTASFAALPIPPSSTGVGTEVRPCAVGRFLYYMNAHGKQKTHHSREGRGGGGGKGESWGSRPRKAAGKKGVRCKRERERTTTMWECISRRGEDAPSRARAYRASARAPRRT